MLRCIFCVVVVFVRIFQLECILNMKSVHGKAYTFDSFTMMIHVFLLMRTRKIV